MASEVRRANGSAKSPSKMGLSFWRPDSTSSCTPLDFDGSRLLGPNEGGAGIWPARALGSMATLSELLVVDCEPVRHAPHEHSTTPVTPMATPIRSNRRVDGLIRPTGRAM